jgi:hypothetical protein
MARPVAVALLVAVAGFAFIGAGYTSPGAGACGGAWHFHETASFPPGAVVCHTHPEGGALRERVVLPWAHWGAVALLAAASGLVAGPGAARLRRSAVPR